ncbi:hypothetical protein LR69_03559 [Geobacillus sp. BCO2]|nr:hypothetical protein LR69_03559 [Geobacillus sp. BCO2]
MSHFYERKAYRYPLYALAALAVLMAIGLFYFQWLLGLVALLASGLCFIMSLGRNAPCIKSWSTIFPICRTG